MKNIETIKDLNFDIKFYEEDIKPLLNGHDADNWSAEFGRGMDIYVKRIKKIGLDIGGLVLDAGGGAGNWSIPLALVNKHVDLIDILDGRLLIAQRMVERLSINNVTPRHMSIEEMSFPNEHFDAIICYSVIMFTDVQKTLTEFHRVLKPGGRLFVQADLWRWYFGQGLPPQTNRVMHLIKFITKKLIFKSPALLTKKSIQEMIQKAGFEIVDVGQDGETSFSSKLNNSSLARFYEPCAIGCEELVEVCARKL